MKDIPYTNNDNQDASVINYIVEWKFPLSGDIFGNSFSLNLIGGSQGINGTTFNAEVLPKTNQGETSLASNNFSADAGAGPWSMIWNFTTWTSPAAPTLTTPGDDAISQPVTANCSWKSVESVTGYRVQISTLSDFTVLIVDDSTITATLKRVSDLSSSIKYYWRVSAENKAGPSSWSVVRHLSTWVRYLQTSGTMQQLNAVFFADVNTGTVAGNHGTILQTTDGGSTNCHPCGSNRRTRIQIGKMGRCRSREGRILLQASRRRLL
ncbi:hypothetical protein GX408_19410 [bacterium]|nr:hypothetical protein [bacterium]